MGDMPAAELIEWTAFERVYGPILVHERIDFGFATLTYYLVSLLSQKRQRRKLAKFLPYYMQELLRLQPTDPNELRAFFQGLVDADNFDSDGRRPE